jgi:multidrug efflux system membrane fusion protein
MSRRTALIAASVVGFAVLGLFYWYWSQGPDPAHAGRPARAAVPVSVATASREDVPVYLTGLGTVQALFTVGIHAQVDGKLQEVFFKEGQRVNRGDVLAKIDPRLYRAALDAAKAHKALDEAALTAAVKDLARFQALVLKNAETQQNVDLQQSKVDQNKASIAADDAAIETAQTNLDYTDIVAPNDGRMGVRMVDPGNILHANDQGAIAILTQTEPITVTFTLPAQTLDDVRDAMARGAVEVAAYDRDNTRLLSTGTLTTIDNLIDPTTASFRLKATFKNADEKLWPGEFVNARLLVDTRKDVVVIPPLAVQRGPRGLFAWVVKADGTVEPRPIQTSTTTGDRTIVSSGVNDGDRVVTDGQYKLQANAPVTITAPPTAATPGNAS